MEDKYSPDKSIECLKNISIEFRDFCDKQGSVSETDTRIKLIDRVLKEVLYWPEPSIAREERVIGGEGYTDYRLKLFDKDYVAIEAKRESISFKLPSTKGRNKMKLQTLIDSNEDVGEALIQVRKYCDDLAIKYAIATNGYAWIVFRAIREDIPWKQGYAIVFYSINDIIDKFTDFWSLLFYESITNGEMASAFASIQVVSRGQYRVIDDIYNADLPLERNRFNAQLDRFIQTFFKDIADQEYLDILQSCYVYSKSVEAIETAINDSIPRFLFNEGTRNVISQKNDAGIFHKSIEKSISFKAGKSELYLILGGIGSGKTTFLKRYYKTVGTDFLDKNALWFQIDLLAAPLDNDKLESNVWQRILDQYREKYSDVVKENRHNIKKIFANEISVLDETKFKAENLKNNEYEKALSPYLEKWQSDNCNYVPKLLQLCQHRNRTPIICIDNVDQLPSEYQAQIFLLAQSISRKVSCILILSLREETYYSARIQKTFTAYSNQKFHIASPKFLRLISKRINKVIETLELPSSEFRDLLKCGIDLDVKSISVLFNIINHSFCVKNINIIRLIESICFGNMRLALELFSTFLTSGATDVDKMLKLNRDGNPYIVSFHEFTKSVMLGDRRYYKDSYSYIMNIFYCGNEKNSSHFTALRVLKFLDNRKRNYSIEGEGYQEIVNIINAFDEVFDNQEDLVKTFSRLLKWNLIEVNTRSTESIAGARYIKINSAGRYYLNYLVNSFCYLDLVLQDTPFDDENVKKQLVKLLLSVDRASSDSDKLTKTKLRFDSVEIFISYLAAQEKMEIENNTHITESKEFNISFVNSISERYNKEKLWILGRLT